LEIRALIRFHTLEAKLARNLDLKSHYTAFIKKYLNLGHMSLSPKNEAAHQYYLPHYCVQKLESTTTKLLVVFDGSAKSTSGCSLNDLLYSGPSIQPKTFKDQSITRCLSYDDEAEFPFAAKIICTNLYVDDLISGGDSYEEVVEKRQQAKELLDRRHFPIPKWCSNEPAALDGVKACDASMVAYGA